MDKRTLKVELLNVFEVLKEEGYSFDLIGISPVFVEFPTSPYILQVYATTYSKHIKILEVIIKALYQHLEPEHIKWIDRVRVCKHIEDFKCRWDDMLLNQIPELYQPQPYEMDYAV